jgi:hypothetical protein
MIVAVGSAGSPIVAGATLDVVTSEPVGAPAPKGASVIEDANVESLATTVVGALGVVVDASPGTDVAACGTYRDGPPGAVVEVASVVAGEVVDDPSTIVVDDPAMVVETPSAKVVDEPSATVVLEVSTGVLGAAKRTGRSKTAPVTWTKRNASSWLSTPGKLTTIASP